MAKIHQFGNNPEEDEFYLVEIYWFITYTLVEPSINQQFKIFLSLLFVWGTQKEMLIVIDFKGIPINDMAIFHF